VYEVGLLVEEFATSQTAAWLPQKKRHINCVLDFY